MDLEKIQALIKFVAKSGVSEVDLETNEFKISIKTPTKKKSGEQEATIVSGLTTLQSIAPQIPVQTPIVEQVTLETSDAKTEKEVNNYIEVKSPMIGTFYRSSSPEKPPFINIGDNITVGQTICIVEAMKLFNEIESEINGKIVKVLVDDSTPIEYDQPLFLVDPA